MCWCLVVRLSPRGRESEGSIVGDCHALSRLLLGLALCMLTACVLPQSTDSPVHTFVLTMEEPDRERGTPFSRVNAQGVLLVGVPQAAAGFEQPRMAFLQRPSEVSYYASHFWVDAPSRMLAPLLIRSLEQSGTWRVVVPMPSALRADHQLDVSGVVVQQEFVQRPSHSRVRLRAQLTDVKTQRVVGARSFDRLEPAPSEDAYGGVLAANRAVSAVLADVNHWIAGCLREAGKEVC